MIQTGLLPAEAPDPLRHFEIFDKKLQRNVGGLDKLESVAYVA